MHFSSVRPQMFVLLGVHRVRRCGEKIVVVLVCWDLFLITSVLLAGRNNDAHTDVGSPAAADKQRHSSRMVEADVCREALLAKWWPWKYVVMATVTCGF